jgi:hypothetical protein
MTHHFRAIGSLVVKRLLLLAITLLLANAAIAQTAKTSPGAGTEDGPVFHVYRGIEIGWLADDVRKKLGAPAAKDDEQDYFVFGEKERAQIYYDKKTRMVTTISVDFNTDAPELITPQQVFGADVETKADGSKHRLVRYPKAGFWVSYSRTAGDTPIITVTLQKM